MILDSVCAVMRYTKVTNDDGSSFYHREFEEGKVFYGKGAASDAHDAELAAEELNGMYKTSERHYGAVRMDYCKAIKEGLLNV
ncbi:hypothetical protein NVP1193O_221 [Vibrio phage 1.193.O._10N.286.52.C6]|nr:hypothetical protein NVP1193O_221 [Vibrio phage 1.193.O._10N.286.52.C6]